MTSQRPTRNPRNWRKVLWVVFFLSACSAGSALTVVNAQMASGPATAGYKQEPGIASTALPKALREIGFDQNIDQRVPLDATFRDESGAVVRLGDYFGKRPVVLVFAYYDCPMLCTMVINGLSSALGVLSLRPRNPLWTRRLRKELKR